MPSDPRWAWAGWAGTIPLSWATKKRPISHGTIPRIVRNQVIRLTWLPPWRPFRATLSDARLSVKFWTERRGVKDTHQRAEGGRGGGTILARNLLEPPPTPYPSPPFAARMGGGDLRCIHAPLGRRGSSSPLPAPSGHGHAGSGHQPAGPARWTCGGRRTVALAGGDRRKGRPIRSGRDAGHDRTAAAYRCDHAALFPSLRRLFSPVRRQRSVRDLRLRAVPAARLGASQSARRPTRGRTLAYASAGKGPANRPHPGSALSPGRGAASGRTPQPVPSRGREQRRSGDRRGRAGRTGEPARLSRGIARARGRLSAASVDGDAIERARRAGNDARPAANPRDCTATGSDPLCQRPRRDRPL